MRVTMPSWRLATLLGLLSSCLAATAASAASPAFSSAKFALTTVDGSSRLSDSFTPTSGVKAIQPDEAVKVESDEIIRIQFTLPGGEADKAAAAAASSSDDDSDSSSSSSSSSSSPSKLPEQVVIQIISASSENKVVGFVPQINKANGRAAWSQRVDRLPLAALGSPDPTYIIRLLVASSSPKAAAKPVSLDLGQVVIPSLASDGLTTTPTTERERQAQELGFYPWPERRHTFRKEVTENMPSAKKSVVVLAVLVAVPWVVLAGILGPLLPSLKFTSRPRISTSVLIAALFFLETLAVRYYKGDFKLFGLLPWFVAVSAVAAGAVVAGALDGVGVKGGVVGVEAAKR